MSGIATSVIPLLSEWEKYSIENPGGDIPGFAHWILARQHPQQAHTHPSPQPHPAEQPHSALQPDPTSQLKTAQQPDPAPQPQPAPTIPSYPAADLDAAAQGALLIARNHHILRLFSKPMIKALGLTKDVEFSAIVHVAAMDHPNKKELCRELLIENSTGVEITRRLVKKGLIAETSDPHDRRSALLSITKKGREILQQAYPRLSALHSSFLVALGADEKHQLVDLLGRINRYHTHRINNSPDLLD